MKEKSEKILKSNMFKKPNIYKIEAYVNNIISYFKDRYSLNKIYVTFQNIDECFTNGFRIVLGTNFYMFAKERDKNTVISLINGVTFHEVGHVLYTPFDEHEKAQKRIISNPGEYFSDKMVCEYIEHILPPVKATLFMKLYHEFFNRIEDGRIERLLLTCLKQHAGLIHGLKTVRKKQYSEFNIDEYKRTGNPLKDMRMFGNWTLQIAKYGVIKDEYPLKKELEPLIPLIKKMVYETDTQKLIKKYITFLEAAFEPFIKPYLEYAFTDGETAFGDERGGTMGEGGISMPTLSNPEIREILRKTKEAKEDAEGCYDGIIHISDAGEDAEENDDSKTSIPGSGSSDSKKDDKGDDKTSGSIEDALSKDDEDTLDTEKSTEKSDAPKDRESDDGKDEFDSGFDDENDEEMETPDLASEVEKMKPKEAEDDERSKKLEDLADDIDFGSINPFPVTIISPNEINRREAHGDIHIYNTAFKEAIENGKKAAKKIKPFFDPDMKRVFEKNHFAGQKYRANRAFNPNLRHFDQKVTKPGIPSLSVAILVDESGSMSGQNISAAKRAAVALFETCSELGVPFCTIGHTENFNSPFDLQLRVYCNFNEADDAARVRLLSIDARENNRDGAALRYTAELLKTQNTDKHLLIIISDGLPAAYKYSSTEGKKDIQGVIREFERQNVTFIAAAIGEQKKDIEKIYGAQRFLDISDLSKLPDILSSVLRRHILERSF